jgi:DNA-binding HxlR family transcriptional regulator
MMDTVKELLEEKNIDPNHELCQGNPVHKQRAVRDAMDVLSGKWKIQLISTLRFRGKMRFMDLLREVDGIAAKMLSKELQNLEANKLITRTVCNTKPITVEYEITEYGKSLDKIILEILHWGSEHRKTIMSPDK